MYWLCWGRFLTFCPFFNLLQVKRWFFCLRILSLLSVCARLWRIRVENVIEYLIWWTRSQINENDLAIGICVCIPIHFTLIDYRLGQSSTRRMCLLSIFASITNEIETESGQYWNKCADGIRNIIAIVMIIFRQSSQKYENVLSMSEDNFFYRSPSLVSLHLAINYEHKLINVNVSWLALFNDTSRTIYKLLLFR